MNICCTKATSCEEKHGYLQNAECSVADSRIADGVFISHALLLSDGFPEIVQSVCNKTIALGK